MAICKFSRSFSQTTLNIMIRYFISFVLAGVLLCGTTEVDAFASPKTSSSLSPLTQDALEIFNQKFPFERKDPPRKNVMGDFGMPNQDFDGTRIKKPSSGKRFGEISRETATESFNELAGLYGDDRALGMVKALPICLAFDKDNFAPSLAAWKEKFGEEQSKDMVKRNPNLLAIKPDQASASDEQTMAFSYIVGYTRPVGAFLMIGLLFLLMVPFIESVLGTSISASISGGL